MILAFRLLYDVASEGLSDFPNLAERKKPPAVAQKAASSGFFSSFWGAKK